MPERSDRIAALTDTGRHTGPRACPADGPDNPIFLTRQFLQPPPCPCDHPPGEGLHKWDDPFEITTPARGDAWDFVVTIWCSWCAQPKTDNNLDLAAEIDTARQKVRRRIHTVVRATAREFLPHLPAEAEVAVNEKLAEVFLAPVHDCDDVTVSCTVQVWVAPCEEVRARQRELYRGLIEDDAKLERTRRRVARVGEERDLWVRFFEESEENWRSRHAVRLADQEAAQVMEVMERLREKKAEQFLEMLNRVISAQQQVNVFDLVISSESALRSALKTLGVPVPEPANKLPWEDA